MENKPGAPLGNQNAVRAKEFRQALKRALSRKSNKDVSAGLDLIADTLVAAAVGGEQWAVLEVANRIDGKVPQAIVGDSDGDPINIVGSIERIIRRADSQNRDG